MFMRAGPPSNDTGSMNDSQRPSSDRRKKPRSGFRKKSVTGYFGGRLVWLISLGSVCLETEHDVSGLKKAITISDRQFCYTIKRKFITNAGRQQRKLRRKI